MTEIITFGCRLNIYESEIIKQNSAYLQNAVIINSCAVTGEAVRQVRQTIRKIHKTNPEKKIIVTGCAAQLNAKEFAEIEGVYSVLGNEEKLNPKSYEEKGIIVNNIMEISEIHPHLISSFSERSRAFVQIQNGCDHRCTFCIIPFARGNSRSVLPAEAVLQIKKLVESGYKEVVLTGVDISDYGNSLPKKYTLGKLVCKILQEVPNLPRLRISSIDMIEIDDDLLNAIATETRLMPHLHLSIQSGDDMILKRMKRRHNRDDIIKFCQKILKIRPDMTFGADIIAGFPTETEEMFANTLALVEKLQIAYLHIFPYSIRKDTPAARMPQIINSVKKSRAKILRNAGQEILEKFLRSNIGKTQQVLMEKNGIGRAENFAPIYVDNITEGELISVKITEYDKQNNRLLGEIA